MQAEKSKNDRADGEQPASVTPPNAAGWDPYEVWRTRILLPRQRQSASDEADSRFRTVSGFRIRIVQAVDDTPKEELEPAHDAAPGS